VDPAELLELLAGAAEHAKHFAIQAQFVDAAGKRVGDIEHLFGGGVMHSVQGAPGVMVPPFCR